MSHPLKGYARYIQKEVSVGYCVALNFVVDNIGMAKVCRVEDSTNGTKRALLAIWKSNRKENPE